MIVPFARPTALYLLFLLPLLLLVIWQGGQRRRLMIGRLGQPEAIAVLTPAPSWRRVWSRVCLLGAVAVLIVVLAGPRWGKGDPGVVQGRDLMIALDLSKSMLADDMDSPDGLNKERWQAAQAGVRDLIDSIRVRGGHRVGLVVFAKKAWLVCPLTSDYDHFLMRLDEFSPKSPPPQIAQGKDEQFPSDTRIGAGIAEAVKWHDPRFPGYQDVLLISDGDDPSAEDRDGEIAAGIGAAIKAQIPVYVVGVGDPKNSTSFIYERSKNDADPIGPTKLEEEPLKKIAEETRGVYLPAHRNRPRLAEFFHHTIEPRPSRQLSDDAVPEPRDRALWFLGAALVLFLAAWIFER